EGNKVTGKGQANQKTNIAIVDAFIDPFFEKKEYRTDKRNLNVEVELYQSLRIGNPAYFPDGSDAAGEFTILGDDYVKKVAVDNGKISKVKKSLTMMDVAIILMVLFITCVTIAIFMNL